MELTQVKQVTQASTLRAKRVERILILLGFSLGLAFPIFVVRYGCYTELLTLGILMVCTGLIAEVKLQHRRFWINRHPALLSVIAVLAGWALNTALRSL